MDVNLNSMILSLLFTEMITANLMCINKLINHNSTFLNCDDVLDITTYLILILSELVKSGIPYEM